jgi:hypothetical protein
MDFLKTWLGKEVTIVLAVSPPKLTRGKLLQVTANGLLLNHGGEDVVIPSTAILTVSSVEMHPDLIDVE